MAVRPQLTPPEAVVQEAWDYAGRVMAIVENRPSYTSKGTRPNYFWGYLGEWALVSWLSVYGIRATWQPQATGRPDDGDIFAGGIVIDAKALPKPTHRHLMIPEAQFKRHHNRDLYVPVMNIGDGKRTMRVLGAVSRGTMEVYGEVIETAYPTRRLPLTQLDHRAESLPRLLR